MPNFVYDNPALPAVKTDKQPIPGGGDPNQFWAASDGNTYRGIVSDVRNAILAGQWYGLLDNAGAPLSAAGGINMRSFGGRFQLSEGGGAWTNVTGGSFTGPVTAASTGNNDALIANLNHSPAIADPYGLNITNSDTGSVGVKIINGNIAANHQWQFFITNNNPPSFKIGQANVGDYLTILPTSGNAAFGGTVTSIGVITNGTSYSSSDLTTNGNFLGTGTGVIGGNFRAASYTSAVRNVSTSVSANATASIIFCNATPGTIVVTLPSASGTAGQIYTVKKVDGTINTVTLTRSGGDNIDGANTLVLSSQYNFATVVNDGASSWFVVSSRP